MKFHVLHIFLFFNLCSNFVFSQNKKANYWHFRYNNGLSFKDSLTPISSKIGDDESSTSISDIYGNQLFYSNGNDVFNKHNKIIKNGRDVGFPISNNITTSRDGSILVSHPDNLDTFVYLFNTDYQARGGGLVYSKILTYGNNDSGEVIEKKKKLIGPVIESISAINHSNGRDIWIVCHGVGNNFFYSFLLTKDGINNCPILSSVGTNLCNSSSTCSQVPMKFSPDGKKIALERFGVTNNKIDLFKFNNVDGKIYNNFHTITFYYYTFEFSHDSKSIFYRDINKVTKVNLDNYTVKSSTNSTFNNITGMQLSNNGLLLMVNYDSKDLIILKNPNDTDFNSNYVLKSNFFYNNAINFPTFNQSCFYTPAINYSYEMNCTKNSIQFWGKDTFEANSYKWQRRKAYGVNGYQLIGSTKDINYTFSDTGTFEVRYIASNGNKADTVVKSIVLYDKIKKDFLGKDTVFAEGDVVNKTLFAPVPNHCVQWHFVAPSGLTPNPSPKERGTGNSLLADSVGTFICKVTNQAFCEVWDTIIISECINNLNQPSLFRSRDTLRTWHFNADSFVWYRNNQVYHISKEPFIALTDTGIYRVEAAKKGHCNSSSIGTNYVQKLNIKGLWIEDLGIRVFPNPSNDIISIQSQNPFKLKVNNILGQIIYEGENINNIHLQKGVYFLHFEVDEYRTVEKVVVW